MNINEEGDLSMFCRVCLQMPAESEILDLNLIYDEEDQLTYQDCFVMCTQINIAEDDGLPQNLCRSCGLELQMAYDFYRKVEESKRVLAQLQDQQPEEITETVSEESALLAEADREDHEALEDEEHLDFVEYQAIEHLEEEDAETIEIKIKTKSEGEEYLIETISVADYDDEMIMTTEAKKNPFKEQISWEDAVVTVANEEHLPVKLDIDRIKMENSDDDEEEEETINNDSSNNNNLNNNNNHITNSKENHEVHTWSSAQPENIINDDDECISENKAPKIITANQVLTAPARSRYIGQYSCDHCGKLFPNHSRMRMHRRSHATDRPKFPCPQCDRLYATKQAMEVHMRTVHIKKGFICPLCSKLYVIKKSLEVHMRYHTGDFPYACDLCDKKFAQIGHLNTHRNVKHNSVRFCCEYADCGKFFTSSTSLRNHEFSHGEMPFQCAYCEKGYPSKSKLKVHIRRKHGMNLTLDDLEPMRQFKTARTKLNLVKLVECEG